MVDDVTSDVTGVTVNTLSLPGVVVDVVDVDVIVVVVVDGGGFVVVVDVVEDVVVEDPLTM